MEAGDVFLHEVNEPGVHILIFLTEKKNGTSVGSQMPFMLIFTVAPHLFNQLYCIHGDVQGHVFPLVYRLPPNRRKETYARTSTYIRNIVQNLGFHLNLDVFQMDIEVAAHGSEQSIP